MLSFQYLTKCQVKVFGEYVETHLEKKGCRNHLYCIYDAEFWRFGIPNTFSSSCFEFNYLKFLWSLSNYCANRLLLIVIIWHRWCQSGRCVQGITLVFPIWRTRGTLQQAVDWRLRYTEQFDDKKQKVENQYSAPHINTIISILFQLQAHARNERLLQNLKIRPEA